MNKRKIYIDRLFPQVNEMKLQYKLKINEESLMYISIPCDADQITKIAFNHMMKYVPNAGHIIITDATAGVGGNTLSFAKKFSFVNAIEIDCERFNYLSNNVRAYHLNNVKLYNLDCQKLIPQIMDHNVIFIDPPWGGKNYKNKTNIRLLLSDTSIEDICIRFFHNDSIKLIILKLPKNYDIEYVYKKIKTNIYRKIYFYELPKMSVLVIENGPYALPCTSSLA